MHYDEQTTLCSIYATRPDICRVDVQYKLYYQAKMTWEQFVGLNLQACEALQRYTPINLL
jgi:hypothetical protein